MCDAAAAGKDIVHYTSSGKHNIRKAGKVTNENKNTMYYTNSGIIATRNGKHDITHYTNHTVNNIFALREEYTNLQAISDNDTKRYAANGRQRQATADKDTQQQTWTLTKQQQAKTTNNGQQTNKQRQVKTRATGSKDTINDRQTKASKDTTIAAAKTQIIAEKNTGKQQQAKKQATADKDTSTIALMQRELLSMYKWATSGFITSGERFAKHKDCRC
ncbi:hypothetical protein CHS0354_030263 [Potamilus streckersoni]|uniref:Uncharacterized protein n=1 Tax=Potamilus streckersoni TaxID=2493646 RepID=A0AAE0SXY1_9BIVA|nr:hypothetical protein CHS0354_030263 [Potamilus streckersoni]